MALRAMELYEAYEKNMLPKDEGYVISAFVYINSAFSLQSISDFLFFVIE